MAFLIKKINLDRTDGMITLGALHLIKNSISYNKNHYLLAKHLGLMTIKVLIVDFKSQ